MMETSTTKGNWWSKASQGRTTVERSTIPRSIPSTVERKTIHINQTQSHMFDFFNKRTKSPRLTPRHINQYGNTTSLVKETKQLTHSQFAQMLEKHRRDTLRILSKPTHTHSRVDHVNFKTIHRQVNRANQPVQQSKHMQLTQMLEELRRETLRSILLGAVHKKTKRKHRQYKRCITRAQRLQCRRRLFNHAKLGTPRLTYAQTHKQEEVSPLLLTNKKHTWEYFSSPPIQDHWRKEQELIQLATQRPDQEQWSIKQRLDHLANMARQRQNILAKAEKRKQNTQNAAWERRALISQKQETSLLRWLNPPSLVNTLRSEYLNKFKSDTQTNTPDQITPPDNKTRTRYQSAQAWNRWNLTNALGVITPPKQKRCQTTLEKWSVALPRILGEQSPINNTINKTPVTKREEWPPLSHIGEQLHDENTEQSQQNTQGAERIKRSIFSPRPIQIHHYKHAHQIKVATLNCPGIAAISPAGRIKRRAIRRYCVQNRIDILALQETHTTCELSVLSSFFSYKTFSSTVSASSRGVAFIIFNHKIKILGVTDPKDGMMYSIRIEFKERKLTIVNFYSPPDKTIQQKLFIKYMALWDNTKPILFLGDWNFLDHPVDDTVGRETDETLLPPQSFEYLRSLYGLVDTNDILPNRVRMTRWNVEHSSGTRLDRIYITGNMMDWIIGSTNEAIPCKLPTSKRHTISDHNIVSVTLSASTTPRGEGYWKLNTQILKSVELQQKLQVLMSDFIMKNKNNPSTFKQYDQLKALIRGTLRDWSVDRAKKIHQETQDLKDNIEEYTLIIENDHKKDIWKRTAELLLQARHRLAQINSEIAQGAWIRSRAKWDFQADKSTKMYFNLERSYSTKKKIAKIKDEHGKLTTRPEEIVEVFRQFYQNLYSHREIDPEALSDLLQNLSLSTDLMNSKSMAKLVSKKEIREAIKITKRGSSPGPDGLPVEFYKLFPQWWGRILEMVYKEIARTGRIPYTMTESFITLLPKKSGDILNAANWRPISLLNSDYKILTKVWAGRLNLVMQEGIGLHQTGFIPGRDIRENILLIQTMIDRMSKDSEFKQAGILLLDLAKAYDRISHASIWAVIEKLNFPQHGLQFLKAIYRNPVSWILCNGFLSKKVQIKSGVRQGCPLSPQIFTLVAELLSQNIIKDPEFRGYKIHGNQFVKFVGYADDTAVPITSIQDAKRFLATLKKYELATASLTNKAKTYFVAIGDHSPIAQYFIDRGFSIKQPGTLTIYLGIPVGVKPNYNSTWDKLLADIKKSLRLWNKICSNVYGRALILKSKGLSKLWYVASMLPLTPYASSKITEIQKECTAFFWAYKGHKLRYANLMNPPHLGGFNLWHLKQKVISLQLKWMTKLENPSYQALWKTNATTILNIAQKKSGHDIPLTHSTKRLTHPTDSAILNNFLEHWHQTLDRSPKVLKAGDWVASLSETETPHWVYRVKQDLEWNTDKKGKGKKIQNIPLINLEWFPQNNIQNPPSNWTEKLHTLVPITVRIKNQEIIRATATFPPIAFMKYTANKIQQISKMKNKDYYSAVQSWNKKLTIKKYKWPNIAPKRLKEAFLHNHRGRVGASIKQTRWLVLTHCLPVGSRLHKINNQVDKKCPNCNVKETIRHCLFTCTTIHYIWAWFKYTWEAITADEISGLDTDDWICNDHESAFPEQLRETINIIIHRIWINRNKKKFNSKELIRRRPAMLIDIAAHWNRHIRAQLHQQKMRQEQAIFYRQTIPYVKGWKTFWQRIRHVPPIYNEWARLQNTEGDYYTQLLLHNPVSIYNKTGAGHIPTNEWKQSKNKSRKRQTSTAGIAVGAHRHPQQTHTQTKITEKQTERTVKNNKQKMSSKNIALVQHISELFTEIQQRVVAKQMNPHKEKRIENNKPNNIRHDQAWKRRKTHIVYDPTQGIIQRCGRVAPVTHNTQTPQVDGRDIPQSLKKTTKNNKADNIRYNQVGKRRKILIVHGHPQTIIQCGGRIDPNTHTAQTAQDGGRDIPQTRQNLTLNSTHNYTPQYQGHVGVHPHTHSTKTLTLNNTHSHTQEITQHRGRMDPDHQVHTYNPKTRPKEGTGIAQSPSPHTLHTQRWVGARPHTHNIKTPITNSTRNYTQQTIPHREGHRNGEHEHISTLSSQASPPNEPGTGSRVVPSVPPANPKLTQSATLSHQATPTTSGGPIRILALPSITDTFHQYTQVGCQFSIKNTDFRFKHLQSKIPDKHSHNPSQKRNVQGHYKLQAQHTPQRPQKKKQQYKHTNKLHEWEAF